MKNKIVLIVTAMSKLNFEYFDSEHFFIIGVERGCLDLIEKNVKVDLAISDFDHVTDEELSLIKQKSQHFIKLNPKKDELDGISAINYAKLNYPKSPIKYVCEPSKRYDMNLSILEIMNSYDDIEIFNENSIIKKINPPFMEIDQKKFDGITYVSFFTLDSNNEIKLKNLLYEFDGKLELFSTRCISNEFIGDKNPLIYCTKPLILIASK